jgi:hypothetical protein
MTNEQRENFEKDIRKSITNYTKALEIEDVSHETFLTILEMIKVCKVALKIVTSKNNDDIS